MSLSIMNPTLGNILKLYKENYRVKLDAKQFLLCEQFNM